MASDSSYPKKINSKEQWEDFWNDLINYPSKGDGELASWLTHMKSVWEVNDGSFDTSPTTVKGDIK